MKKLLLNMFKSIEHKNKVQLITELLTLDCTIEESVDMYNLITTNYHKALIEKKNQMNNDIELINKIL